MRLARFVGGFCAFVGALGLGCTGVRNSFEVMSIQTGDVLETSAGTRVYGAQDRNTADFYLTDLPESAAGADPSTLTGTLVHVHMFLRPMAGETPIAVEACSFTVRQAIFTGREIGIYGGGGFLTPGGDLGSARLKARFRGATLRLIHATAAFEDRLGPSEMKGEFEAVRDDARSAAWAGLLARAMAASEKR
jgi:hypothetical protein